MIEQKAIYEAAQTAFSDHHPKFPWPKRHDLEDQTDEFKRAFLQFSAEINAMHEREIESIAGRNVELTDLATHRCNEMINARNERDNAVYIRNMAVFAAMVFFAVAVFVKINS